MEKKQKTEKIEINDILLRRCCGEAFREQREILYREIIALRGMAKAATRIDIYAQWYLRAYLRVRLLLEQPELETNEYDRLVLRALSAYRKG